MVFLDLVENVKVLCGRILIMGQAVTTMFVTLQIAKAFNVVHQLASGKNPTNLKTPLFSDHSAVYKQLQADDTQRKTTKQRKRDEQNLVAAFKRQITVQRQQQSAEVDPEVDYDNALNLWRQQRRVYSELMDVAEDLISNAATQAYVERVFSVCDKVFVQQQSAQFFPICSYQTCILLKLLFFLLMTT